MTPNEKAAAIVQKMMDHDAFSQWLGIQVVAVQPGSTLLKMTVREEMVNGFNISHGGIAFSLADSALAFAANGHGRQAVSIKTDIAHHEPVRIGDTLFAKASEIKCGHKVGYYEVVVTNQDETRVATFTGMVSRSSREWDV